MRNVTRRTRRSQLTSRPRCPPGYVICAGPVRVPRCRLTPSNLVGGLPVSWTSSGMKHFVHAHCHGENASPNASFATKDEKQRGTYLFQLSISSGRPARRGKHVKVWWIKLTALRRNRVSPVADARMDLQFRRHDRESTKHTE